MNTWSSRLNFILAATGAAVGLGAIWRFPYIAGKNGGSAFVLVTILAILLIGIPIMIGEILLGRLGRVNPITTMKKLAMQNHKSPLWQFLGWWGALALLLVLSFYSVVAGWSIAYIFKLWTGQLQSLDQLQIISLWNDFLANPWELLMWHSIFMCLTMWVVTKGIQNGLEQASKIMMPGLFIVLIILTIYNAIIGDFAQAINFLFAPDFSKLNHSVLIDALGQAFFSLAIGAGCMLTYGCYVPQNTKIIHNVFLISTLIIIVSVLSGLTIFPLVFAYSLPPESGPELMFYVLPIAFNSMPMGTLFGGLFFLMLLFAAWTSSISMAEPQVMLLIEHLKISRLKAAIMVGGISWILGGLSLLSFNILKDVQLFGTWDIFSAISNFATNIILPTGALGFAIFAGWALKAQDAKTGLNITSHTIFNLWRFTIRYISPLGILLIFLSPIL